MITEETVKIIRCDNPRCTYEYVQQEGDDFPGGFNGTANWGDGHGSGMSAEWFADKERCIRPAIEAALDEARRLDREGSGPW
jgi:hypothetical protein